MHLPNGFLVALFVCAAGIAEYASASGTLQWVNFKPPGAASTPSGTRGPAGGVIKGAQPDIAKYIGTRRLFKRGGKVPNKGVQRDIEKFVGSRKLAKREPAGSSKNVQKNVDQFVGTR